MNGSRVKRQSLSENARNAKRGHGNKEKMAEANMDGHEPIRRARELGWMPQERNKTAHKHFYFDGPVPFSATKTKLTGTWLWYTVGDTTTSDPTRAVELLETAAKVSD